MKTIQVTLTSTLTLPELRRIHHDDTEEAIQIFLSTLQELLTKEHDDQFSLDQDHSYELHIKLI